MTEADIMADPEPQDEPTVQGWYRTAAGADWMIYSLAEDGQGGAYWTAHVLNGDSIECTWEYIDQAGPVELISAYPRHQPSEPDPADG